MSINSTFYPYLFLNFLLRKFLILQFVVIIFLFNFGSAQIIISDVEKITITEGTVIYIDSTRSQPSSEEIVLNEEKNPKDLADDNREKLAIDSQLDKKPKPKKEELLSKKLELVYRSNNDSSSSSSSFSLTDKNQFVAFKSNSQWKILGIIDEAKYRILNILYENVKINENNPFYNNLNNYYKSSRSPPLC